MTDLTIRIDERRHASEDDHMSLRRVLSNMTRTTGTDVMDCRDRAEARARIAEMSDRSLEEAVQVARETNAAHETPDSFEARLGAFVAGCQFIRLCNYESRSSVTERVYPHELREGLYARVPSTKNARYVKLVVTTPAGEDRSVYCFVDLKGGPISKKGEHKRGSVLKSESWKKPAPHARGDIMAEDFGLTGMRWTGAHYLVR